MTALKWILSLFWRERVTSLALMITVLVIAVCEMLPPYLIGRIVNHMTEPRFTVLPVVWILGAWLATALVLQLLHSIQIRLAVGQGERMLCDIRRRSFGHMQFLPMAYFDRVSHGRLMSLVGSECNATAGTLFWGLNTLTIYAGYAVAAAYMLTRLDARLLVALTPIPLLALAISITYGRRLERGWAAARERETELAHNLEENIRGARVVAAFNRQRRNLTHYNDLQALNSATYQNLGRQTARLQTLTQALRFGGVIVIFGYGAHLGVRAGDLVSASLYWEWLMLPAVGAGPWLNDLLNCLTASRRLLRLFNEAPIPADPPGARPLPRLRSALEFRDVRFAYQAERDVLHALSFTVPAGQTVALVGATGSGKSTVMSLLARFYEPTGGRILIDGVALNEATRDSLYHQMSIVLQTNFVFTGTVWENLRFGRPDATQDEMVAAAKLLGAHSRIEALPQGYDTRIGDGGLNLSLGERQLICFTRALVGNPRLLLLDEATSALDPQLDARIQQALARLTAGRTTFIVTHRLRTAVNADRILLLDHGRLLESGSHEELVRAGGRYAKLYQDSLAKPERTLDSLV